jgi:site-specific recombinase XerC
MPGFNTTTAYGQNASQTEGAQGKIANLQSEYQRSVLGDPTARDQDGLRQEMFKVQALLGTIRQFASWLVQEQKQNLEASKGLTELAKV